jgi:hypothetical protein
MALKRARGVFVVVARAEHERGVVAGWPPAVPRRSGKAVYRSERATSEAPMLI